jgi:DNA-binding transcriptional MocR family regulator
MTPPGTFDRVYAALKERLRTGVYRPGTRLEPTALSEDLNASVTPVRDALHRLTGERLVDAPRHEGFRVPMLTEPLLRELYRWHHDLVVLASLRHRRSPGDPVPAPGRDVVRASDLFRTLGQQSGDGELMFALDNLLERIEPLERFEGQLLDEIDRETAEIAAAVERGDRRALRRNLGRYHRRRERIVPLLLASILQG